MAAVPTNLIIISNLQLTGPNLALIPKGAENLPRFGLVSPCEAERRRVRVVPIIGGESGDKEFTD